MNHTEDVPIHIIETLDITTGVLHDTPTPVIIIATVTPIIADHLHTGAHQPTLRIRADHIPVQCTNQVSKLHINLQCVPADLLDKLHHKRSPRFIIDDPQMDFYSSEDNSSDSEDDWDHLN